MCSLLVEGRKRQGRHIEERRGEGGGDESGPVKGALASRQTDRQTNGRQTI
jgi:hypothetical protein